MFKRIIKSHAFRRRVSWIIAIVLIAPLIFFFHLFSGSKDRSDSGNFAGTLLGQSVSFETFQEQYDWARRDMRNRLGDLPESLKPFLIRTAWDRLILLKLAKESRIRITDEELATAIHNDPTFIQDGYFIPERYHQYVRFIGMSPRKHEELLRKQLLIEKFVSDINSSVGVTKEELRQEFMNSQERLSASIIVVNPDTYAKEVKASLTEQDLRNEYETHPKLFEQPAQVTFEYIGASRNELEAQVSILEDDISDYYDTHEDAFLADDGTMRPLEDVREEIRQQLIIQAITRQLTTLAIELEDALIDGLRFVEIALLQKLRTHIIGPIAIGSSWLADIPEPALLQAAYTLEEGQMSELIETSTGVYLVNLTERKPPHVPLFSEISDEVQKQLVQQRARGSARDYAKTLREQLMERLAAGEPFIKAAESLSATPIAAAPFTRTQPIESLGSVPSANEGIFETSVGTLSEVIVTPQAFVLAYPHELIPPDEAKWPEEKNRLRDKLISQKQASYFAEWIEDVRRRAELETVPELKP